MSMKAIEAARGGKVDDAASTVIDAAKIKAFKLAISTFDRDKSSLSAGQLTECKRMLAGYVRLLKLQNKEREAADVGAKIAR